MMKYYGVLFEFSFPYNPKEQSRSIRFTQMSHLQVEKSEELKPEKVKESTEKDKEKSGKKKDGNEEPSGETGIEVDGEKVLTENVPRGTETSYHTRYVPYFFIRF